MSDFAWLLVQKLLMVGNIVILVALVCTRWPVLLMSYKGRLFTILGCGVLLCTITYFGSHEYFPTRDSFGKLGFAPSGDCKKQLTEEIVRCGLDPEEIPLWYSFLSSGIAIAFLSGVAIDAWSWKGFDHDPGLLQAKQWINLSLAPGWKPHQKELFTGLNACITPQAQEFIFRHELGHIYYNHLVKQVIASCCLQILTVYASVTAAHAMMVAYGGWAALAVGAVTGAGLFIATMFISAFFINNYLEKQADHFAAGFSSPEEIEHAASMFEQHERCMRPYKKVAWGAFHWLPGRCVSGHPHGNDRSAYLRVLAQAKRACL